MNSLKIISKWEFKQCYHGIKRAIKLKTRNPNSAKIAILNPDTNTTVIHEAINNIVCPRSGWLINKTLIRERTKKEYRCLPQRFVL